MGRLPKGHTYRPVQRLVQTPLQTAQNALYRPVTLVLPDYIGKGVTAQYKPLQSEVLIHKLLASNQQVIHKSSYLTGQ